MSVVGSGGGKVSGCFICPPPSLPPSLWQRGRHANRDCLLRQRKGQKKGDGKKKGRASKNSFSSTSSASGRKFTQSELQIYSHQIVVNCPFYILLLEDITRRDIWRMPFLGGSVTLPRQEKGRREGVGAEGAE